MRRYNRFLTGILLFLLLLSTQALAGDLYLNLIWHQHQPLYVDPQTDQLRGPWVRTHATKDYYDMAAMHADYPEVHATINLTSSLLMQLQTYYVDRLGPFLYDHPDGCRAIHSELYFAQWGGKTDPWIDLALKPTAGFTDADKAVLLTDNWNAFGIAAIQIARFPEYAALRDKPKDQLTAEDLTAIKAWFYLGHFDPDFLRGTAKLDVNLTDLVTERGGLFYLKHALTERDANRLVADAVRVMQAVVPEHKKLMYDRFAHTGQIEVITSPFYHPILPLLIDSDVARICQPRDALPPRFSFPEDAISQLIKSRALYESLFGKPPVGMWPAEGSISPAVAHAFAVAGIEWMCGDMHVLQNSEPRGLPVAEPYRVTTGVNDLSSEVIVFRETTLSDHIGFTYQNMDPDSAAKHFLSEVLKYRPGAGEADRLLTVILDGENAWEWYSKDMDGKRFLRNLYSGLTEARAQKTVTCVTPSEYIYGNPARGVPRHHVNAMTEVSTLWPGSWINANFDTWIGEPEENKAWGYLLDARQTLGKMFPTSSQAWTVVKDSAALKRAWESMYAAEGSDWFWWFGADQTAPGGDLPFEQGFFSHLRSVYENMRQAGADVQVPVFQPILSEAKIAEQSGGVMSQGAKPYKVRFVCDATAQQVNKAIYIVGNLPELGSWQPNSIRLYDDGTHGDFQSGDGMWTLELMVPVGTEVQYKYTNSGEPGAWVPSEEFSRTNRVFTVDPTDKGVLIRADIFGKYE